MDFRSDNVSGVVPEILAALAEANRGPASAYGDDALTRALERRFAEVFEREVAVFPVATGTAANALALSALAPPWGAVYCHRHAHVQEDECGAVTAMSGGVTLLPLGGAHGRIDAATLAGALATAGTGVQHHVQPAAVTLTQASERGTVYDLDRLAAIAAVCRAHGLALHLDGARFANALVHLGCSPAAATWQAGVDVLSFGATKNGAMAAEAVVFFDPDRARDLLYRRKRAGHLISKMRFVSAQLLAYLADDLWLRNAGHANAMAARLGAGLAGLMGVTLADPVEANEVFVSLPEAAILRLEQSGFRFHRWGLPAATTIRLVCAFDTEPAAVDAVIAATAAALA